MTAVAVIVVPPATELALSETLLSVGAPIIRVAVLATPLEVAVMVTVVLTPDRQGRDGEGGVVAPAATVTDEGTEANRLFEESATG
jgi:hypothetical protein